MTDVFARLDEKHPGRIVVESGYEHREALQAMLSRKWSVADKVWTLPLAWSSCLQLRSSFGDDLQILPDLAEWATKHRDEVVLPSATLRKLVKFDEDTPARSLNDVCEKAHELGKEVKLFPHQSVGAAFMATNQSAGIFDETGTGKSAQTIAALRSAHRAGREDIFPVLIVAPNTVKTVWSREWKQWWPGLTVRKIEGSPAQRRKIFETPAHVYIINYEQMHRYSRLAKYGSIELKRCTACGGLDEKIDAKKCEVHERELNQIEFNTVVCDEIHRCLHPTSKQTRAVWAVADKAKHRYGLTGTPIQDNIADFWAVLRFLRPEEFPSKTRFMDRYADIGYSQWGMMEIHGLKKDKEAEFRAVTEQFTRRMLKKIVLPFLPPIIRERRYIDLTPPQRKAYRSLLKEAKAELSKTTITGVDLASLVADSPLSVVTRLLQFASSYGEIVSVETPEVIRRRKEAEEAGLDPKDIPLEDQLRLALPSNKISAFLGDVEAGDFGDSSIVVFAQSVQLINLLSAEMTAKGMNHGLITGGQSTEERQRHIDEFQDGKTKYILVTIQAGGVGLTLTAADTNVFLQRAYSSTAMTQALSRSHRIGAEKHSHVTIIDYISEHTHEEKQLNALSSKDGRIEEILRDKDLLRDLLSEEEE